ncbi:glycosyltransferase family 4 protein [Novosphingobium sp. ST904]|uniref:glycosyltransferase family 4 protein n=1 Tax=Novosphingobium sp. ST904 TaxID=1684385 RepID=UPI0006C87272|nr:glycosyltransferase family 4 protein [Novosphingobium sp. ST904]KPH65751.1 hypothetical protein ADT71_10280 [Novosphingobium sp. ST904]TCM37328.1 glycosyltransferase involved in cell wall biosynthesis [Novosphingobium sp. ST904]
MKICVTGLRGIPGVMGGVETHCEELLPRIAATLVDTEIEVCCRAPYVDPAMTSFRGVALKALYCPTGRSSEAIISTLFSILYARTHGATAIHIHAVGPGLLAPLARLLGLKVLLTHHGADYEREKWGRGAKWMLRMGEKLGVQFANTVVCVSPSLTARMKERYPGRAEHVDFIPNGVSALPPCPQPDDVLLAEMGLQPGNYLCCVARLVPEKGIHYLIEAHARSGDPRTLVIAGAAKKSDRYAQKLAQMAGANVRFLGMVPRAQLGVLLRNASLFVLPSFHEGLPIAALEALASNCPVLLSDIQPNLDLGLPADCYFPVGDVGVLATRLSRRDSPRRAELPVEALMDWDEVAQRTAVRYREILSRSHQDSALKPAR